MAETYFRAQDEDCEQALLGLMLQQPALLPMAREMLTLEEFWQPRHQKIYATMLDLADEDVVPDPTRVLGEITTRGQLREIGGAPYLHTLFQVTAVPGNFGYYADRLKNAARVRRVEQVIERLGQARQQFSGDMDPLLDAAARQSVELLQISDDTDRQTAIPGLLTVDEFVAQPDRAEDFIVPDFMESQDVWMLLAGEGAGKSWMSRQLTECIAAGIHPWHSMRRIEPRRTLLVDLENAAPQVRRQTRPLLSSVVRMARGNWDPDRAWIWHYPGGLNLRNRADAALFERVIEQTRPEFVAFGSLYKAFTRGRDDWDTAAEDVRVVFDRLRARYGISLWLEHHMPKGDGKTGRPELPFGSSVWQRWAGFGRVLKRVGPNMYELKPAFRGDRDQREFPLAVVRGGDLPWSPVWDEEELNSGRDKAYEE